MTRKCTALACPVSCLDPRAGEMHQNNIFRVLWVNYSPTGLSTETNRETVPDSVLLIITNWDKVFPPSPLSTDTDTLEHKEPRARRAMKTFSLFMGLLWLQYLQYLHANLLIDVANLQ